MDIPDRIIRLKTQTNPYGGGEILSQKEFIDGLSQRLPDLGPEWFVDGIEVDWLTPGGQWQNAKMSISLSFVSQTPPPPQPTAATATATSQTK